MPANRAQASGLAPTLLRADDPDVSDVVVGDLDLIHCNY